MIGLPTVTHLADVPDGAWADRIWEGAIRAAELELHFRMRRRVDLPTLYADFDPEQKVRKLYMIGDPS